MTKEFYQKQVQALEQELEMTKNLVVKIDGALFMAQHFLKELEKEEAESAAPVVAEATV